jgi:gliding motility-associated-like protein
VLPSSPTTYYVQGIDEFGCIDYDSVFVDFFPTPVVDEGVNAYAFYGDEVQLTATSPQIGVYSWSPIEELTCVNCASTVATPNRETVYTVTITDQNGCQSTDIVTILYDITIYVPNTFTPDQDEFNQSFYAYGGNIREFHMMIFNRWGELIFETYDMKIGWDGTYNGRVVQSGTYTWIIECRDAYTDKKYTFNGNLNLLKYRD